MLQLAGASGLKTVTTDTDGVQVGDTVTAVGDGNGTVSYLSAAAGKVMALSSRSPRRTRAPRPASGSPG